MFSRNATQSQYSTCSFGPTVLLVIVVLAVFVIHISAWLRLPGSLAPWQLHFQCLLLPCSSSSPLHPKPQELSKVPLCAIGLPSAPVLLCSALNTGITSSQSGAPEPVTRPLPPLQFCLSHLSRSPAIASAPFKEYLSNLLRLSCNHFQLALWFFVNHIDALAS